MRYNERIKLIKLGKQVYDYETGDTKEAEEKTTNFMGHVSDLGVENQKLLFGAIEKSAKIFRLKGKITLDFDTVEYEGIRYRVKSIKTHNDDFVIYGSVE